MQKTQTSPSFWNQVLFTLYFITYKFSAYTNCSLYFKKLKYFLPTLLKAY